MTDNFSKLDVCNEISEDLSAFIDGELSKEQLAKIYEHLLECKCCQNAYAEMKTTQKAIKNYFKRSTEEFKIPENPLKENVLNRITAALKQKRFVYSATAVGFLAIISYFSISLFVFNLSENEALHKIKFTKEKPVLMPEAKDFTKELKDEKVLKKKL